MPKLTKEQVDFLTALFKLIAGLIGLLCIIIPIVKKFILYIKNVKVNKLLRPHFEYNDVKNACKYYISTRFQNQSPSRAQEPLKAPPIASENLIKYLLKNAFKDEREDKFYLVLADTGMGKTTFMINLYIKYNSFFNFNKKYNMKLLRFSYNNINEDIHKIKHKENTILLLDAFDEYKVLNNKSDISDEEHFINIFNKIIESLEEFYLVIITSRTQYFPNEEHNPYDLSIKSNNGYHTLKKLYISPFNSAEIKKYLNKKYGIFKFWNISKKLKAIKITESSKYLMVRPMLLNYVDYLIGAKDIYSTYDIYTNMIDGWLTRESMKRKHKSELDLFKDNLFKFSRLIARELNKKYTVNKELTLEKEEVLIIAKQNNINISSYEITGQSLLTKNARNMWKFSHKSIYEYFLAYELINDPEYCYVVNKNNINFTTLLLNEYFSSTKLKIICKCIVRDYNIKVPSIKSKIITKTLVYMTSSEIDVVMYAINNPSDFIKDFLNELLKPDVISKEKLLHIKANELSDESSDLLSDELLEITNKYINKIKKLVTQNKFINT